MPEITLIPKKEKPGFQISFQKLIFYFPLTLLILVVLIFLGFFIYNFMLQKSVGSVEKEIKLVEDQRDLANDEKFVNEIFSFSNRIINLKRVLNAHINSSAVFPFFEKLTLPKTRYYNFGLKLSEGKISARGEVEGYIGLIKQMIVFSRSPEVKEAKISGIDLSPGGKVSFGLELSFDKKILFEQLEQ